MLNLTTFGGNVEAPVRTCECVLCGKVQEHDVCNNCHMQTPDGEIDNDVLNEMIAADLQELADAA